MTEAFIGNIEQFVAAKSVVVLALAPREGNDIVTQAYLRNQEERGRAVRGRITRAFSCAL